MTGSETGRPEEISEEARYVEQTGEVGGAALARRMVREFVGRPDEMVTWRFWDLEVGALARRQVRAWLHGLRIQGMAVTWHEEKGLLDSIFAGEVHGTGRQVSRAVAGLVSMAQDASASREGRKR